ncbi:type II toxin-antitoxin system ParD family antitoxin [Tessaracoccus terricola]
MRTTKQLSITLPNNMAEALKARVASGAYASESEVIRDGLRALFAREEAVEAWLRAEVVASYDELRADPSQAISSDDMRTHLNRVHRERLGEVCHMIFTTQP